MIRTILFLASEAAWSLVFRIAARRFSDEPAQFHADAKIREDILRQKRRDLGKEV